VKPRVKPHPSQNEGVMVKFDILTPARLLYEDAFELTSLVVAVDYDNGRLELKKIAGAGVNFDSIYEVEIELPPCAEAGCKNLTVIASYKDGTKIESDPITVCPPTYGNYVATKL